MFLVVVSASSARRIFLRYHEQYTDVREWFAENSNAAIDVLTAAENLNYLTLQAALEGQGLVMARRPFAAAELANGRLIQPFNLSVNEPASWIQVTKHKPEPGSTVCLFTEWLQQEIDSDLNFKVPDKLESASDAIT